MNTRRGMLAIHAILSLLISATLTGCGFVYTPSPPPPNFVIHSAERIEGLPETYAPGRPIYAYHMWDNSGAYGSVTSIDTYSDSKGDIPVVDGRVNARWHVVWKAYPCAGKFWEGNVPAPPPLSRVVITCVIRPREAGFGDGSLGYILEYVPDEYWEQHPDLPQPPGAGAAGTMSPDQYLYPDQAVYSPSGQFRLQYQWDGNLVLVDTWAGWTPVWASGTNDNNPGWAVMQGDGNFVVYDGNGSPVWHTGTAGNGGAYFYVGDNGSLAVFSGDNTVALWWSPGV